MTSIFDQYKQDSLPFVKNQLSFTQEETTIPADEKAVDQRFPFNLLKVKMAIPPNCRIQYMAVGRNKLVYITSNNLLVYSDWKTGEKFEEIDISKAVGGACKVRNLFLDPTVGCHLLIPVLSVGTAVASTNSRCNELLYLNLYSNNCKVKQIVKLKSHEITAIGWNRMLCTSHCSSFILVGTSKGLIFEMEINWESEKLFQNSAETYSRQVFDIGKGNALTAITGIEFYRFTNVTQHFFILVTTSNRIYQFMGKTNNNEEKPVFSQIFNFYLNIPEGFIEIPNSNLSSILRVYHSLQNNDLIPTFFAWHIGEVGVLLGKFNLFWEEGLSSVCVQTQIVDYNASLPNPLSIALAEFHVLLLYADKLVAISNINKQIMFVCKNNENFGKFINMFDDSESNIWILSERSVLKGNFNQEDGKVWKIYMDMNEFPLAKQHCRNNTGLLRAVMRKEAEYYFNCGLFKESAALYAQLDEVSFEEIALKFLQVKDTHALKLFLYKMLDRLRQHESAHITVVSFWLFEIFEKQFSDSKMDEIGIEEFRQIENDLRTFLSYTSVVNCVKTNKEIVYRVLNSHGDVYNFVNLANTNKDRETMIKYYLEKGEVDLVLTVIQEEPLLSTRKRLIDLFLTELVTLAPKETVDSLIKLGRNVEPSSFLPSLIIVDDDLNQAVEVIRYLEYCVLSLHSRDESIHNYLITLYVKCKPEKLMQYLATQGPDSAMVNYDIRYALKLCQEYDLKEACVQLYSLLGLWENAVDLALTVNLELAKQTAIQPSHHNTDLCKRLWLKIAQHVVHECNDIKKAMEFLRQCDLIKIEDVLPFFSDFVTINLFKDAICCTLQEYNEHIEHLKEEIDDAINSADSIRADIQSFKHKYMTIHSTDVCCCCDIQLVLRPFYVFPCSHYFHKDCLMAEIQPHLDQNAFAILQHLQHQSIEICPVANNDDALSTNSTVVYPMEDLKLKLNDIIANECFFCGSLTISYIDKPFVNEEEFDKIRLDWQ